MANAFTRRNSPAPVPPRRWLPCYPRISEAFAGWVAAEAPKKFTDAAQADPANAAALKEYDFTDGALASYKRSGETLSLRALRFHDASGAYGAYSFYRQNGWPKEEIGTGATSNHNRVLFWLGNTVVDANFSHIGPMSGGGVAGIGRPVARSRREQGDHAADSGHSAQGSRWTGRPRTMRWDRRAMRERAECCRRSWWASIAARRP